MNRNSYHTTKSGDKIKIKDLETDHLFNILSMYERMAEEGVEVEIGGGIDDGDPWYDTYYIYGDEVLEELEYDIYKKEFEKRMKKI